MWTAKTDTHQSEQITHSRARHAAGTPLLTSKRHEGESNLCQNGLGPLSPRAFGLGALLRRRLQRGLEGGPLLLCALVIEQIAPGPALERPRHGLVALGDVGEGGPLLRVAGSGGETRWVWVARSGACLRATPPPPSPNPPPPAGARGGYGLQSGGQSAKGSGRSPRPNFCNLSCGTGGA